MYLMYFRFNLLSAS